MKGSTTEKRTGREEKERKKGEKGRASKDLVHEEREKECGLKGK